MITSVTINLSKSDKNKLMASVEFDELTVVREVCSPTDIVLLTDRVAAKLATYMNTDDDIHICPWCGEIMGKVRNKIICPECGEIIDE